MVRAKFTVQHGSEGNLVVLIPQYDPASPEDQRFSVATPSGRIEMVVDNPPARDFFKPGKTYYVDFTAAEPVVPPVRGEEEVKAAIKRVKGRG